MTDSHRDHRAVGLACALAAYGWWGLAPLYFKQLVGVSALETLAHRILWSLPFLALLLTVFRQWGEAVRGFTDWKTLRWLLPSTLFVAVNWGVFIYGVFENRMLENSLGYYINPLVSVLLGVAFLGEKLRPAQLIAVALAVLGVVALTVVTGSLPWISLTLALSFGVYGLLRKLAPIDGLAGLTVEVILLSPLAAVYLIDLQASGALRFGSGDGWLDGLLLISGVVTGTPLIWYGMAARRLPLYLLGFLQYLGPTIQFLIAWLIYEEPVTGERLLGYGLVWAGLAVFSLDALRSARRGREPVPVDL